MDLSKSDTAVETETEMLDHDRNRRLFERDAYRLEQNQGPPPPEHARVENMGKIFGRERHQHRSRKTFGSRLTAAGGGKRAGLGGKDVAELADAVSYLSGSHGSCRTDRM